MKSEEYRWGGERGQAHTLEGIIGGLLLLSGLVFALQATAVTPLSASTSSQHIENQLEASAEGVLAVAADDGSLKNATLNWNESSGKFYNLSEDDEQFTAGGPPNAFGRLLNRTFADRRIAFNVYLIPLSPTNDPSEPFDRPRQGLVYRGAPSDNAVTASRIVTIYESDRLLDANGDPGMTVTDSSTFYAGDAAPNSTVYNLVQVRVVVWRM
jgi:hypothetical protein